MALAQALVAGRAVAAAPPGGLPKVSSALESSRSCGPALALGGGSRRSSSSAVGGLAFKTGRGGAVSPSFHGVVRDQVGRGKAGVVCAVGDVSADGTPYLIAGALAVALIGTAFPFIFSRKDICPDCGGAGFVRGQSSGGALRANAARKDQQQIVCKTCNGLGKLGQTDKV